ncbi:hypothetical protein [Methylocystis parvus]|uniref:Uncharacterized protein n=1 Tax=Methylocystis parvus TaxID=134 RepID=A0A6B8M1C8_9HYPH|nr:hypothetical protein [Methylocystis parvus]QGM96671.1 hypothetical protein F7D14_03685 [Methylocystis parvus]WBJ99467.1 hypothetical protein MMG94_15950 [Methylocystis parvus OBBP]
MARKIWLFYAVATIAAALVLLSVYVNAYDDYDIGDRLRAVGRFARLGMAAISFPLGPLAGLLADRPLESAFACGDPNEPCAFFLNWNTRFAALCVQIAILRWAAGRR